MKGELDKERSIKQDKGERRKKDPSQVLYLTAKALMGLGRSD